MLLCQGITEDCGLPASTVVKCWHAGLPASTVVKCWHAGLPASTVVKCWHAGLPASTVVKCWHAGLPASSVVKCWHAGLYASTVGKCWHALLCDCWRTSGWRTVPPPPFFCGFVCLFSKGTPSKVGLKTQKVIIIIMNICLHLFSNEHEALNSKCE